MSQDFFFSGTTGNLPRAWIILHILSENFWHCHLLLFLLLLSFHKTWERTDKVCTVTNKFLIFGEKYNLRDTTALNDTVKWQTFDSVSCSKPLRHTRYGAGRLHQTAVDEEEVVICSFLSLHRTVTNGEKHPAANTRLAPLKWNTLHLEMSLKLTDCWLAIMSIKHWSLFLLTWA